MRLFENVDKANEDVVKRLSYNVVLSREFGILGYGAVILANDAALVEILHATMYYLSITALLPRRITLHLIRIFKALSLFSL